MNDPWDVKSVRRSGQYQSCMRLNGVPLLPPILSKDCHKEMQYYKLLAKEVEKRISIMQKMNETAGSDSEDHTDAPELPECEQSYDSLQDEQDYKKLITELDTCKPIAGKNGIQSSKMNVDDTVADMTDPPKLLKDMNSTLNETNASVLQTLHQNHSSPTQDIPERDCTEQDILDKDVDSSAEVDTGSSNYKKNLGDNSISLISKDTSMSDLFTDLPSIQDGPSSLNSKSFTGSLNNLHSESLKDSQKSSGILVRQLSYTLLQPSPQLLAHLEFQAQNNGIEMNSISMSESFTNVSNPKKRRNWDLQTAKEKWSDMAQELKNQKRNIYGNTVKQNLTVKAARQVITPPNKRNNGTPKPTPKSEPIMKKKPINPVKNNVTTRTADSEPITPNANKSDEQSKLLDQGVRVRELYEKIQKQQLVQMETLVEKQKKEQILLQQVFEEQNKMLLKQLKTICPKSPIEVKEAWGDKHCEGDRGPVSLSQLMNCKTSALSDTNSYLNRCDNVLKKSRDITGSLKKRDPAPHSQVNAKNKSSTSQSEGSRTRTHSPIRASTSRRLNYDTSVSSDRENDPILTDRTNDTMADLNVTFPSDYSDEANSTIHNSVISPYGKETRYNQSSSINSKTGQSRVLEKTVSTERSLKSNTTLRNSSLTSRKYAKTPPKPEERAAATKIVAYVKGYLVRRLMRTERVQGIVQTIKDALLCALQLHQDREGIRGADVDLHRRLIQQITAACYALHDTFVASTPAERCAMIGADRSRRHSLAARQPSNRSFRQTDIMSQSHSGVFPARTKRQPTSLMTQSNYETFSGDKSSPVSRRYMSSPRRRPWR